MENINDYLKSGSADKSFSDVPYNEVDALVFSTLAYIPMDGKVPGLNSRNDTITIQEFVDEIKKSEKYADFLKSKKPEEAARFNDFVQSLKNSERYKDVTLNNFSNIYKPENEEQFAAVTINLPDGSSVASELNSIKGIGAEKCTSKLYKISNKYKYAKSKLLTLK